VSGYWDKPLAGAIGSAQLPMHLAHDPGCVKTMSLSDCALRSHYSKPCQRVARSEILLVRVREVCILIVME